MVTPYTTANPSMVAEPPHGAIQWFLEGRPTPRMDVDRNGRPRETLISPTIVADLWDGGWVQ